MRSASLAFENTREGLAFRQRRVAAFGLITACLSFAFLAFRIVASFWVGFPSVFGEPASWFHLLAVLLFLVPWLACRRGARSRRVIDGVETIGILGGGFAYLVMGMFLPVVARPELVVLLALTYALVARSVYVPSSAHRTLALGVALGLPLVVATFFEYRELDPQIWAKIIPGFPELTVNQRACSFAIATAVWWSLTVFVCTAASDVIFGLRREVRDVKRLGQYTLRSKIGEGGMGVVYAADHAMLRRPTAVKLLPPEKMGAEAVARFEREVQLTASLTHPNTVTIYDYGRTPGGVFYYAMEFLDGATLAEIVSCDGPMPPGRVVKVLDQVAGALTEAHGVGLIHRDIKPANIMLLEQGGEPDIAKVLDFGLVKEIRDGEIDLTQADTITGTPQYLAPEQMVAPSKVGPRSDLYALGAVGYYMLTGLHLFDGETAVAVINHHINTPPVPPSERSGRPVPEDLERLLLECVAKEPEERPESAPVFRERLHTLRGVEPWTTEAAHRWWCAHRDGVCPKARADAPDGPVAATLEIDLRRHLGELVPEGAGGVPARSAPS